MSDESKDIEPEAAKGGLFKGQDGKLSGRKILGFGAAAAGVGLGILGAALGLAWQVDAVLMGGCFGFSAIMYGFLTAQNGKALIAAVKGQP